MKEYVRSIVSFFRCDPRAIIGLLTETEVECLALEAMLNRSTKVGLRCTILGYPTYVPDYVSIERN